MLPPAADPVAVGTRPWACGSSTGRPGFTRSRRRRTTSAAPSASSRAGDSRAGTARLEKPSIKPATALDYFLSGRELASRGRYDDAIDLLRTAVQLDLDQTSAHLLLAVCYTNVRPRQLSAAMTSLDACIRSHPNLVGLYLLLLHLRVRRERGSQQGRRGRLREGRNRVPHRPELKHNDDVHYALLCNRGLLRMQSGRLDEAATDLNAAIRLKPSGYQAHTTLAQVLQARAARPGRGGVHAGLPAIPKRARWPGCTAAVPCSATAPTSRPPSDAALRRLRAGGPPGTRQGQEGQRSGLRARLFLPRTVRGGSGRLRCRRESRGR